MKLDGSAHLSADEPQDSVPTDAQATTFKFEDDELRTLRLFIGLLGDVSFTTSLELAAVFDSNGQAQAVQDLVVRLVELIKSACRNANTLKVSEPQNVVNVAPAFRYLVELMIGYQVESGVAVPFVPDEELVQKCLDRYFELHEQKMTAQS